MCIHVIKAATRCLYDLRYIYVYLLLYVRELLSTIYGYFRKVSIICFYRKRIRYNNSIYMYM